MTNLIELGPNQLRRFYRGGNRIEAFRGLPAGDDDAPEDWVASTIPAYGERTLGMSRLDNGTLLADALARDPSLFFEPAHLEAFGAEPLVLIKLLDAGERLPVHLHPDDAFAQAQFGTAYGKTEAWIILEAEPDAYVHAGFKRELDEQELAELVAAQEPEALLAELNPLPVSAGDSIFVPAGLPHAIGKGILLLELQQPADLSLLLEGRDYLGLSEDVALGAVTRTPPDLERLTSPTFPPEADRFFRAEVITGGAILDAGFSVVICDAGGGTLSAESGGQLAISRGSTVLVPYAAGAAMLAGEVRAIRCRPPVPS